MGSITRVKNRIHALLSQQSEDVQEQISRVKNLFGTKGMKVLRGLSLPGNQKELLEALVLEENPQHLRDGEDHLPVEDIEKEFLVHPLAPLLNSLRMTGWAETAIANANYLTEALYNGFPHGPRERGFPRQAIV